MPRPVKNCRYCETEIKPQPNGTWRDELGEGACPTNPKDGVHRPPNAVRRGTPGKVTR